MTPLAELNALAEAVAKLPDDVCTVESSHPVVAKFLAASGVPTIRALVEVALAAEGYRGASMVIIPDGSTASRLDRALAVFAGKGVGK